MRLAELQVHHDTVISTNNDYVDKIATLEFSFGDLQGHYENAQSANTELTSSNVELAEQVGALESANGEIQQENANLTSKIADLANKLSILHSEKESIADEHSSCGEQIANLEAKLQAAKVATTKVEEKKEPETVLERIAAKADEIDFSRIGTATEGNKDDLKRIKGICPYIEQNLNVLGIFTFEQMSNLTEEDVDKINKIIEFFPGRAKRDKWVEQAQNIAPKSSFFS